MTDDGLDLAAADRTFLRSFEGLLGCAPSFGRRELGPGLLLSTALPIALFNPTFVSGAPDDPEGFVADVVAHYRALGVPCSVHFREEVAPDLVPACEAAGLVENWRPPLMTLAPIPDGAAGPAGLEIRPIVDAAGVAACGTVLGAGFGMPSFVADEILRPAMLALEDFTTFVGTLDGVPVGTAAVRVSEGLAGVENVAVDPAHRGRGIGAAMTWAAVHHGRAAGAGRAILQASEMGEPIYRRMGFTTALRYRQFEWSPS